MTTAHKSIEFDWDTTEGTAKKYFDYDLSRPGAKAAFLQFAVREGVPHYRMSQRRFRWNKTEIEDWLQDRRIGGLRR